MNRIIVAVAVLALASCSTAGDEKQVKEVRVTNQTIATQPAGAPYVIDLTRSGTTYDVAAGIDSSRVRVRTSSKEEMTLTHTKICALLAGAMLVAIPFRAMAREESKIRLFMEKVAPDFRDPLA